MGHAILERMLLVGTRSADHIRASGHSGCVAREVTAPCENRPDTWLHPNASQNVRFLLHRGRRPYMAHRDRYCTGTECRLSGYSGHRAKRGTKHISSEWTQSGRGTVGFSLIVTSAIDLLCIKY